MKLPDYQRVIYKRIPLLDVVGQLRFPTLLKINNQEPFEFQERIRWDYPIFQRSHSLNLPPDLAALVPQLSTFSAQDPTYNFQSEDSKWQISLNKDSLTLSTFQYKRYEEFKEKNEPNC
jgi:uncharacterized protein (TIGR04255 family)